MIMKPMIFSGYNHSVLWRRSSVYCLSSSSFSSVRLNFHQNKTPYSARIYVKHYFRRILYNCLSIRFLMVTPISSCDQRLLLLVLKFISSALRCFKSHLPGSIPATPPVLTWLIDKLYRSEGPLMSLMKKSVGGIGDGAESAAANNIKR